MNHKKLFGTDGIRGKANEYPMSCDLMIKVGQALGKYFKQHYHDPRILIGKDTRRSGYMLEQALSSGICSMGVHTLLLGPLPTPGIAYLTRGLRSNAGVVISASHNPYYDNGVKVFASDGYKLPDNIEHELEEMIFSDELQNEVAFLDQIGISKRVDDAVGQYAVFLKEQFPKKLTLEGLKLVVDCANGAAYKVAPKVFTELGAEVITLGVSPNGVNINDQCGALFPETLRQKVLETKAHMGIALDGDADRLIACDDKGEILDGDDILAICASYFKKQKRLKNDMVVATVMSNFGLDSTMRGLGVTLLRTDVGDRYVVEKMRQHQVSLGGEQSGHLIFQDCTTTGDGILAALFLLEASLMAQKPLSILRQCLSKFPQIVVGIPIKKKLPLEELPELAKKIKDLEEKLKDQGRVHFRYSGTELKARLMVEGPDASLVQSYIDELSQIVSVSLG